MNPYLVADKTPTDLLEALTKFIGDNGGRERLAHRLECEMLINYNYRPGRYNFKRHRWTDEEVELLKNSYKKLSVVKLSTIMNRSHSAITSKVLTLRGNGEIGYKLKVGGYWQAA